MKYRVQGYDGYLYLGKPEKIYVEAVERAPYRDDRYTFDTREEAEAEAERIKAQLRANARKRKSSAEARAERIRRLEEYDSTWVPGIKCILDRVKNEQVDKILDGLDHMRGSITG